MKHKLILCNQNGFKWINRGNLWCKGYIYDLNEQFYSGEELARYFSDIQSFSDFEERVSYANGSFSVIYKNDEDLFLGCDIIRSFPLFYRRTDDALNISDNAYELLAGDGSDTLNKLASVEFLATGYVTGNETLIEGIFQVQAGEIINFREQEIKNKFYYSYRTPVINDSEYDELKTEGIRVINNAFQRFIAGLKGRTVTLPLSGGFDSRLIAIMLKKYEYENVVCFTYGRKDNPEINISQKVAEILGFKWIYVEYTDQLISGFIKDQDFMSYYPYAANLVSMFFMQEYFAVKYLKNKNLIPSDSIFTPGHSGDFLGGSQLFKHGNLGLFENIWDLTNRIYKVKYCHVRPGSSDREKIMQRIQKSLEEKFTGNVDLSYSIHEDWDFKEKLSKFNFNSLTTYTYFGYEFRFPLWDKEIVNFFKTLPLHTKINKFLYDDILCNELFEAYGLNFEHELQPSETELKRQRIKNQIKYFLPDFLNRLFMKRYDWIYYKEITAILENDMAQKGKKIRIHDNFYNSLIIQWYLEETKDKLKI